MLFYFLVLIFLHIALDLNYVLHTLFTVFSGRVLQRKYCLTDESTIYGIGTFVDCDIWFRYIRDARIVRKLDFARFHFYDRTGILVRSRQLSIRSLQGSTLIVCQDPLPLLKCYKITTKLTYWDDRSLFLEHKVITLGDGKVRYYLISRQYALSDNGFSVPDLLTGLTDPENEVKCPENIKYWLQSMQVSSGKLRAIK